MTIYIHVEGQTEVDALPLLLAHLYASRRIKRPVSLHGSRFLRAIGEAAAEVLSGRPDAHVFACPDLAPKDSFRATPWAYETYEELQAVLRREVRRELRERLGARAVAAATSRFHAHPFRHDFEVLLLALPERLKQYLKTDSDVTRHYNARRPEDQDFERYPKRVMNALCNQFLRRRYDPVVDARRFFGNATAEDVHRIGALCPCFREFVEALRELAAS